MLAKSVSAFMPMLRALQPKLKLLEKRDEMSTKFGITHRVALR